MKMPSTFVGRGLSLEEAGQALSEITTSVLPSLMVSRKALRNCCQFLMLCMHILADVTFVGSCLNGFGILLDIWLSTFLCMPQS